MNALYNQNVSIISLIDFDFAVKIGTSKGVVGHHLFSDLTAHEERASTGIYIFY